MGCHTWFFRPIKEGELSVDYCAYADRGYTNLGTPHNVFRVRGRWYPDITLLSHVQTLEFIAQNRSKLDLSPDWELKLREFWEDNPGGVIEFG